MTLSSPSAHAGSQSSLLAHPGWLRSCLYLHWSFPSRLMEESPQRNSFGTLWLSWVPVSLLGKQQLSVTSLMDVSKPLRLAFFHSECLGSWSMFSFLGEVAQKDMIEECPSVFSEAPPLSWSQVGIPTFPWNHLKGFSPGKRPLWTHIWERAVHCPGVIAYPLINM